MGDGKSFPQVYRVATEGWRGLSVNEVEEDESEERKNAENQNQHAEDEPGDVPAGAVGGLGDAKGVDESRCKCFKETHMLRIRRLRKGMRRGMERGWREFESAPGRGHLTSLGDVVQRAVKLTLAADGAGD
jgi:hypothetical protein